MVNYRAPGVYVEEVPSGARPIGAVGTSTAGFVGVAPDIEARVDEAVVLDNWTQFVDTFVGSATTGTPLSNAVHGFFMNGGGRCYVVNVGSGAGLVGTPRKPSGLTLFEAIDDIAIVAAPGYSDPDSYEALLAHCEHRLRQDRVAILDTPERVDDIDALTRVATASAEPTVSTTRAGDASAGDASTGDSADSTTGGPDTSESTPGGTSADSGGARRRGGTTDLAGLRPRQSDDGYGAVYFPWIVVRDPVSGQRVATPPSGHMAGIWAQTDGDRGVHVAPANRSVAGALDLTHRVSRGEQEVLNPAGVNCIRFFPREGIRVWGARTVAADASEWKYLNVRRLFNMIKESIADGTRWVVFEPNDYTLWSSIRRDLNAFLTNVWRDGALLGRTREEAFFVQCDEETNPPEVRDAGRVVARIGLAPVKPAEFVVFQLMQSSDATETTGA